MIFVKSATINVNGMRDGHKRAIVFNFLKTVKADIVMIQETHAGHTDHWGRLWDGASKWAPGTPYCFDPIQV